MLTYRTATADTYFYCNVKRYFGTSNHYLVVVRYLLGNLSYLHFYFTLYAQKTKPIFAYSNRYYFPAGVTGSNRFKSNFIQISFYNFRTCNFRHCFIADNIYCIQKKIFLWLNDNTICPKGERCLWYLIFPVFVIYLKRTDVLFCEV